MKKIILFMFVCALICILNSSKQIKAIDYYARSYIVMDYNTGEIMEGKDYHLIRSVASISKIMTAIVAIENSALEQFVKVSDNILKAYGVRVWKK